MSIEISIIVPVFRAENTLAACVKSVLVQDFRSFELILVDDGSTDSSKALCDAFAETDDRVLVLHKTNGGANSARIAGLNIARGEWIMFLDADDMLRPDALNALWELTKKFPDADLIEGNVSGEKPKKRLNSGNIMWCDAASYALRLKSSSSFRMFFSGMVAKLIRKSLFRPSAMSGIPEWVKTGEDWLCCLLLASNIRCAIKIEKIIYFYRDNPSGLCASFPESVSYILRRLKEAENIIDSNFAETHKNSLKRALSRETLLPLFCKRWREDEVALAEAARKYASDSGNDLLSQIVVFGACQKAHAAKIVLSFFAKRLWRIEKTLTRLKDRLQMRNIVLSNMTDNEPLSGNVLFFYRLPMAPERGGVERVSWLLAKNFEARGRQVFFLSSSHGSENFHDARQLFLPDLKKGKIHSKTNELFLKNLIREKKISFIICQNATEPFPFPRIIAKFHATGLVFVHCIHGDPNQFLKEYKFGRLSKGKINQSSLYEKFRERKFLRKLSAVWNKHYEWADAVVLLSERFRSDYCRHTGRKNAGCQKLHAIPNPATYAAVATDIGEKKKELLFVGRMSFAQKRPDLLLRAWEKLQAQFPDWSLRFVGDGDYLPELKQLAGTLGAERVSFEGFRDPASYYRDALIFCMTSAYEGFGMVLVEAAAFGCVPVAFDSFAAVRDIIDDGENGALVPAFDLDAYAETLARLMRDDALRERLAKNALAQIPAKFSPQKIGDMWEKLFTDCSSEKRSRR